MSHAERLAISQDSIGHSFAHQLLEPFLPGPGQVGERFLRFMERALVLFLGPLKTMMTVFV